MLLHAAFPLLSVMVMVAPVSAAPVATVPLSVSDTGGVGAGGGVLVDVEPPPQPASSAVAQASIVKLNCCVFFTINLLYVLSGVAKFETKGNKFRY